MRLNELGKQKLGRYRNPKSRHSMQSYILTYYRLRMREPLIGLGYHMGVGVGGYFCIRSTPPLGRQI